MPPTGLFELYSSPATLDEDHTAAPCVIRAASMQQSLPRQSTPQLAGACQERFKSVNMHCAQRLLHKASQPFSRAAHLPMSSLTVAAQSALAQAVEAPQPVASSLRTLEASRACG